MKSVGSKHKGIRIAAALVLLFGSFIISIGTQVAVAPAAQAAVLGDDYPANLKATALDALVDPWNFLNRECTSFVAWRLNNTNHVGFNNYYKGPHWGNANNWGTAARAAGIAVDGNPTVGAVAWFNSNAGGASAWGHVAWVAAVSGSSVTIEEYNWGSAGAYHTRTIAAGTPSGYIHVQDLPQGNPFGYLDALTSPGPGLIHVGGWAADPDAKSGPLTVHVYVAGKYVGLTETGGPRPDIPAAFPGYGGNLGYDATFPALSTGSVRVCTYAINVGAGDTNTELGCQTVTVENPNPFGSFDTATGGPGTVSVTGWSLDPNALTTSTGIHMYVGGPAGDVNAQWFDLGAASGNRPDIAKTFLGAGPNHGLAKTVTTSHRGTMRVYVYALNVGGSPGENVLLGSKTVTVTAPPVETLAATPTPTISGTVKVGHTLTSHSGTWKPTGVTLRYQWLRNGNPIGGATAAKYTLVSADKGATVKVTVTGSKANYKTVAKTSKATKKIAAGTLHAVTPKVNGTKKVGSTLAAVPGAWGPVGVHLTYQWYRNGHKVSGATAATYLLASADRGKKLKVKVTGSLPGWTTASRTSKQTGRIK